MGTLRKILIPVAVGVTLLAVIGLMGSVLVVYREAVNVHPALGWTVVALVAAALFLLIVYPVARILRLPRALVRPKETEGGTWRRFLRDYAARLLRNRIVLEEYADVETLRSAWTAAEGASPLEDEVAKALKFLDGKARASICKHAAAVFAATAVSQSGRLDTAIVLSAQLRLVKDVAEIYYQRPHPRELVAVYLNVGSSAFIAGEIQDSELIAVLGAPVSAGLSGLIPLGGTDPLVSLLVTSLLDGSANALLTLRIGVLASRYCGIRLEDGRRGVARSASLEAAKLLGGVVAQGAGRVAGATRRVMVGGAIRKTQRAAEGLGRAGSSAFAGIAKLAEKTGAAARKVTQKSAVSTTTALRETLDFWEGVEAAAAGKRKQEEDAGPAAPRAVT